MPKVVSCYWEYKQIPLRRPYVLSFVTLEVFNTLLVHFTFDDGTTRVGEVVPLVGYSSETVEDVIRACEIWLPQLIGQSIEAARATIASQILKTPCASSLILSALDAEAFDRTKTHAPVPLVYPTSSSDQNIEATIREAIAQGYCTLKVKIGDSLQQDLAVLVKLREHVPPKIRVRFDANQAYSLEDAKSFLSAVQEFLLDRTELVEQPLPTEMWDAMAYLASNSSVPLMLDESIHSFDDVTRAAQVGCQWIKLKLCKQGGITELVQIAEYAVSLGLKVVLGNGVATDISNLVELLVYDRYRNLFSGASESNGFTKLMQPIMHSTLRMHCGCAIW
jgi:L-Ala-D/L-Glu epimerase